MDLFDAAIHATEDEFRASSLAWLQTHIGFDGAIWGRGKRQPDGRIAITQHFLDGRPDGLITDYPAFASADPISQHFIDSPQLLQNVSTHTFYRAPELAEVRDYLEHYRVRHLLLTGIDQPGNSMYDWLVLYREDPHRPFEPSMEEMMRSAMSVVLFAAKFRRSAKACLKSAPASCMHDAGNTKQPSIVHLTERQQQVLHCLLHGWPNKLIARHLAISENTLKTHLAAVYRVLNVTSRSQAIVAAGKLR